jgi:N-acetylneuraminic acid mutarotase
MRTKLLSVLIQLVFCLNCISQESWINRSPLPDIHGRQNDLTFSHGGLAFMGLGYDNNLWCYNSSTNTWISKTPFPGDYRTGGFGFCIGTKIFFGGGNSASDFWEYDIETNSWNAMDHLPMTTLNGVGFSIGSKGYLISGKEFWEYDPLTTEWVQKDDFPGTSRNQVTALTINNKAYLAFGKDETYGGLPDLWEFDPAENSWTKKADCPVPRFSAFGFSINNKGYFGGGYREWYGSDLSDFYEYDPASNVWTPKNSPGGTYGAAAFCINNETGFYGFGNNTCHIGSCEPFNFLKSYVAEATSVSDKVNEELKIFVFPNPSNDKFTINFVSSEKRDLSLSIINEVGQQVYYENFTGVSGKHSKTVDLSNHSKGIYLLKMKSDNIIQTTKIILN